MLVLISLCSLFVVTTWAASLHLQRETAVSSPSGDGSCCLNRPTRATGPATRSASRHRFRQPVQPAQYVVTQMEAYHPPTHCLQGLIVTLGLGFDQHCEGYG